MIRLHSAGHRSRGFSLIEVMIAVVVLTTGLLALAALQGSLTRNSAEAKVRGRVAAMLSARMDELRSTGYGTLVAGSTTVSAVDACDGDTTDWLDCTRVQAGLGSLSVTSTVSTWSGAASFTSPSTPGPNDAQFKRVVLSASWKGAADTTSGRSHTLVAASDISPLGLTNRLIPPPDDQDSGGGGPLVRSTNPATAGVIPFAMGNGSSTAASNPTPELVGRNNNQQIVGTRFNVLTYVPDGGAAVIQKRFENEVIKCACKYGAGGTNLDPIYRKAQWPAIWTGDRYDRYEPSPLADAPGQALSSGPQSSVEQSALCQECCRDHHDTDATGVAKFDPERSDGSTRKYDLNGAGVLVQVSDTSNGNYYNACRVIRVDGFWRTASDTYARQFGLLETETVGGLQAKTGLPTDNAKTRYTTFVKDYLKQYDGTFATGPLVAAGTMFDETARLLNTPALVAIALPSTADARYLHSRGFYVDYLETKALKKLLEVLADTGPQGRCPGGPSVTTDCMLPYLPFSSANLTEIAKWVAENRRVLGVNSGNLLSLNPAQPSGGRSFGRRPGTSDNIATVRTSNSGAAISTVLTTLGGVDPTDDTSVGTDAQEFEVGGTVGTGDDFFVHVSGGGLNPYVFYSFAGDSDECFKPAASDYDCGTNSTLPKAGSIRLENYWSEGTTTRSITGTCTKPDGTTATVTASIAVPTFRNYAVSSALNGTTSASGTPPYTVATGTDGKTSETTTISFTSIAANDIINVTFSEQLGSPIYATIQSCQTNDAGDQLNAVLWNKSWQP